MHKQFAAIRYSFFFGLIHWMIPALALLVGCTTDTGDQTNNRLKQLGITVQEVGQEYVSRVDQLKADGGSLEIDRTAVKKVSKGEDANRGGDPPEMPKTIAVIAENVLIKLRHVDGLSKSEQVEQFVKWLEQSSGKPPAESAKLVEAMREAVKLEPVEP
ncbi:MAG: hypothetical protein C0478_10750 [Planctomyces sp.]|nr:hypothetical protein [Planctomyces sp.]